MTGETSGPAPGRRPFLSRRRFLATVGAGLVGSVSVGAAFFGSAEDQDTTPPNNQWLFGPYVPGCTSVEFDDAGLRPVTVPHCVTPLSWEGWQPKSWEALWVYRQYFDTTPALRRGRVFVRFDGVLSTAAVYLNGKLLGTHQGGYLPFSFEVTSKLDPQSNVLAVVVDGRWKQDVPPELSTMAWPSAIDFYQPAGMYRPVTVSTVPKAHLSDVFARPVDVLAPDRRMDVACTINAGSPVLGSPIRVLVTVSQNGLVLSNGSVDVAGLTAGDNIVRLTVAELSGVALWDVDDPQLCDVLVTLWIDGRQVDQYSLRTGFRDIRFAPDGFFLNGRRVKLFGLNRHQWYPYVGGAMPERVQRTDAEILKNELNCNMVRCSHYPQSTAFLDACDELGLMVWEEIPGWDFVGDSIWQDRCVRDVHDMVIRDRNHPSIIVWGTRINETLGQVEFYGRTDQMADQLDGSRPTSGAVKGLLGYKMPLYEGDSDDPRPPVFAFNDYSVPKTPGELPPLRPPRPEVAYLVSEAIGTLVGPATFRRTDSVAVQQEQAVMHAAVHDTAASDDRYCGLLGWCAFDYPSGWYHSVNHLKSPGVADVFRIPKLGAAFYQSQVDPAKRVVLEPGFYWDFGPNLPRTGPGRQALIWSNCERVDVYLDNRRLASAAPDRVRFRYLDHPPFVVNLTVPNGRRPELRLDGFIGGKVVVSRRFSPDRQQDVLSCNVDDQTLIADGNDATRIVVRVLDRYGAPRAFATGVVRFTVDGPGILVGDNPLDLAPAGGSAAVWLRTQRGATGPITVTATHSELGSRFAAVTAVNPQ